jgi:replicative DNA helicase
MGSTDTEWRRVGGKREVPWSEHDERALLGAALLSRAACQVLAEEVAIEDFYKPRHGHWAEAIVEVAKTGPVDPVTVAGYLADKWGLDAELPNLIEVQTDCPASSNASAYAARIAEMAGYRRYIAIAGEMAERGYAHADPLDELVDFTRAAVGEIDRGAGAYMPPDIDEYLATVPEYEWLVPGQIERRERLMFTGPEGGGKTELLLQLGVQYSAGLNPFWRTGIEPIQVLMVLVENRRSHMKRRLQYLRNLVKHEQQLRLGTAAAAGYDPRRLRMHIAEGGVNLLRRHDRNEFTGLVQAVKPDLVICGPVYKLLGGEDENDSRPASAFGDYVENLCKRFGSAFIIEAHSARGERGKQRPVEPIGTTFWQRWPEFGFGLRMRPAQNPNDPHEAQVWDWVPWKVRDRERAWPVALQHGRNWPWVNYHSMAEVTGGGVVDTDPPF